MLRLTLVVGRLFGAATLCTAFMAHAQSASTSVVISQIYGGGGNKGATLKNDYIELFNAGTAPISINGWTVQHASADGTSWDQTILTGTIQPGQYYLVQEQQGQGGTVSLPAPDAVGDIGISATSDKMALVSNSTDLTGAGPGAPAIVDFVGYGTADAFEGQPASGLNNTTALLRKSGGCTNTGNNSEDFVTGAPNPRNTASPTNPCSSVATPSNQPRISQTGVVNAATFRAGPIAPGEIVTIYGSNLGPVQLTPLELTSDGLHVSSVLAGTSVLFDGVPAPIIYTSANQISAVAPFSISGESTTSLQVEYDTGTSNSVLLPVAPVSIGIFTADSSGTGQAAVLNQDYSTNSANSPATEGSIIIAYATGAGQTTPVGEDGLIIGNTSLPSPIQQVTASIGGLSADVLYAGDAPGLVSGVLQVNLRIPEGLASSGAVPLVISIGTAQSQAGVVVWISND